MNCIYKFLIREEIKIIINNNNKSFTPLCSWRFWKIFRTALSQSKPIWLLLPSAAFYKAFMFLISLPILGFTESTSTVDSNG